MSILSFSCHSYSSFIKAKRPSRFAIEGLEERKLFSESASAQLSLVSTTGTQAAPIYQYDISLVDTGSTSIGTFWFSWIPGENFLPSKPSAVSSPTGWSDVITGSGNSTDGSAIQWEASSHLIATGGSLSGFSFTTTDSPAVLAGDSPSHPSSGVLTSFVYTGLPFANADAGVQFSVSPIVASVVGTSTTLSSAATTAVAGSALSFTATVTPSVAGAIPTGTVVFSQSGVSLGSVAVAGDGTAVLSTSSLATGADSIVATYSGDSNYGVSASSPVLVTITPATTAAVTIAPAVLKSTLPAGIVSSLATKGTVTVNLSNQSGVTQKGKALVAIYASADGSIDSSAILLGQISKSLNLKATRSTPVAIGLKLAAGKLSVGSYTLLARVTYAGNVVDSSVGGVLTVAAPVIALSETVIKNSIPAAITRGKKSNTSVLLSIANTGNITTPATTTVALYATSGGLVDGNAIVIGSLKKPLRIPAGKAIRVSVPGKLISALPAGSYVIVASVTDPDGQVSSVVVGDLAAKAAT